MKRILLFVATNLAVIALISAVVRLLGIDQTMAAQGLDPRGLLVVAAVIGCSGAFISLLLSKWSAKFLLGVRVVDRPTTSTEAWLLETVRAHAARAGIAMPEVGIFEARSSRACSTPS